jgi:hypothetical protein
MHFHGTEQVDAEQRLGVQFLKGKEVPLLRVGGPVTRVIEEQGVIRADFEFSVVSEDGVGVVVLAGQDPDLGPVLR